VESHKQFDEGVAVGNCTINRLSLQSASLSISSVNRAFNMRLSVFSWCAWQIVSENQH